METAEKIIAKNISSFRTKHGYSIQQIAEYLGISKANVIAFESAETKPDLSQLEKMAELFGIDAYDFYEKNIKADDLIFAFKAKQINSEDLKPIARFMKIVRNYIRMKKENEITPSVN